MGRQQPPHMGSGGGPGQQPSGTGMMGPGGGPGSLSPPEQKMGMMSQQQQQHQILRNQMLARQMALNQHQKGTKVLLLYKASHFNPD